MASGSPLRKRAKLSLRFSRNSKEPRTPTKTLKKLKISPQDDELACYPSYPMEETSPRRRENLEPEEPSLPPQPYVGFYNVGNTCYLNSVLQALRYCPRFVSTLGDALQAGEDWLSREAPGSGEITEKQQADRERLRRKMLLLREMHKLYELMQDKEENFLLSPSPDTDMAVNPEQVLEALRTVNPMFEGYLQHDSQELLCSLLSTLSEVRETVFKDTAGVKNFKQDLSNNNIPKTDRIGSTPTSPAPIAKPNAVGSLKGGCSPNLSGKSLKRTIQDMHEGNDRNTVVAAKKHLCFTSGQSRGSRGVNSQKVEVKEEPGETVEGAKMTADLDGKGDAVKRPKLRRKSMRNRQAEMPKRVNRTLQRGGRAKIKEGKDETEATKVERTGDEPVRVTGSERLNPPPNVEAIKRTESQKISEHEDIQHGGKSWAGIVAGDGDKDTSERLNPPQSVKVIRRTESQKISDQGDIRHDSKSWAGIVAGDGDKDTKGVEKGKGGKVSTKDTTVKKRSRSLGMRHLYKLAGQLNILKRKKSVASPASSPEDKSPAIKSSPSSTESSGLGHTKADLQNKPLQCASILEDSSSTLSSNRSGRETGTDPNGNFDMSNGSSDLHSRESPEERAQIKGCSGPDGNIDVDKRPPIVSPSELPALLEKSGTPTITFKKLEDDDDDTGVNSRPSPLLKTQDTDLFWGSLVLRTKCLECENHTQRREEFQDISIPVKCTRTTPTEGEGDSEEGMVEPPTESNDSCDVNLQPASLDWALSEFTLGERLTDANKYFCDRCLHLSEAERCLLFDELPQIMVVHLKRFSTMSHLFSPGGSIPKINDYMATPVNFKMDRWCTRTCRQRTETFQLLSVVTHTGSSSSSGHYLSYVRVPRLVPICTPEGEPNIDHYRAFEWVLFDDDQVTALTDGEFYQSLNTPVHTEESVDTPYLLFYTRVIR